MKNFKVFLAALGLSAMSIACSDEKNDPEIPNGVYEFGYFVSNEGPFQNGSGTITFIGDDGNVSQNIYKQVNGEDLGNIVNSMSIVDDKAYIVVNNTNKLIVVNRFTMEKSAIIEGDDIVNPRFMVASNGLGFVSNWGDPYNSEDDFISVISLESNTVLTTIPVGEGPEKMMIESGKLFVCLQGGYGSNNKVLVIDIFDLDIEQTLTVGNVPNSIALDGNSEIWVLCGGNPAWTGNETKGALYKILPGNYELSQFDFAQAEHPSLLSSDRGNLYYSLDGMVYEMGQTNNSLPSEPLAGIEGFFYSMKVKNGELFATDAGDYASEGTLEVYNVASGTHVTSIPAGIVPGQVVFP